MCMGVSTSKERKKEEILIYDLLQLSSLIHHAVPVHAAFHSAVGSFFSSQPATHLHVWVTSCVLRSEPHQPPPTPFPQRFTVTLLHPETHHDRITHNTRDSEIWQRQICADEYLLSQPIKQPFNSQFINGMLYLSANLFYLMFVFDRHN